MIPAPSIKRKVARAFDRSSGQYGLYSGFQRQIARETAAMAHEWAQNGSRVLDIGCGQGGLLLEMEALGGGMDCAAMDISSGMCSSAMKNLSAIEAAVVRADAEVLPFRKGAFGLVVSSLAMQWVESLELMFREISRVLAPGGMVVASTLGPGTFPELKEGLSKMAGAGASNGNPAGFQSAERILEVLAESFFEPMVQVSRRQVTYDGLGHFLTTIKRVGALGAGAFSGMGLGKRGAMRKLFTMYQDQGGGFSVTYEVIFIKARLK